MELIDELSELQSEIVAQEKAATKAELTMESIATELKDKYGITIDEAVDHVETLKEKSKKLKKKIVKKVKVINEEFDLDLSLEEG